MAIHSIDPWGAVYRNENFGVIQLIHDINDINVGNKVYPLFGLDNPYIASVNPYYVLHIEGDVITWAYGGNCNPHKIKFGQYRLFTSLEKARKYVKSFRRFTWVQS